MYIHVYIHVHVYIRFEKQQLFKNKLKSVCFCSVCSGSKIVSTHVCAYWEYMYILS